MNGLKLSLGIFELNQFQSKVILISYFCLGGYIINLMDAMHFVRYDELKQYKPFVQQMEKEGKVEVIEDLTFPNFYQQEDGHLYVLRKLKQWIL